MYLSIWMLHLYCPNIEFFSFQTLLSSVGLVWSAYLNRRQKSVQSHKVELIDTFLFLPQILFQIAEYLIQTDSLSSHPPVAGLFHFLKLAFNC